MQKIFSFSSENLNLERVTWKNRLYRWIMYIMLWLCQPLMITKKETFRWREAAFQDFLVLKQVTFHHKAFVEKNSRKYLCELLQNYEIQFKKSYQSAISSNDVKTHFLTDITTSTSTLFLSTIFYRYSFINVVSLNIVNYLPSFPSLSSFSQKRIPHIFFTYIFFIYSVSFLHYWFLHTILQNIIE